MSDSGKRNSLNAVAGAVLLLLAGCSGGDGSGPPEASPSYPRIDAVIVSRGEERLTPDELTDVPPACEYTFECRVEDPDGDALTFSWEATAGRLKEDTGNPVHWIAPDQSAEVRVVVTVSDGSHPVAETVELTVLVRGLLEGGQVSPGTGHTADTFTYQVRYVDSENRPPAAAHVVIDGEPQPMELASGGLPTGVVYRFETALEEGPHRFYFAFTDARHHGLTHPEDAYLVGPHVMENEEVVVNEAVIVIDEEESLSLEAVEGTTFTFGCTGRRPRIARGAIIVGTEEGCYLRRVVDTVVHGDTLVVETADATLAEAISFGSMDTAISLGEGELKGLGPKLHTEWNEDLAPGVTLTSAWDLTYDLLLEIGFAIMNGVPQEFHAACSGEVALTATVTLTGEATFQRSYSRELWKPLSRWFVFTIGWFPVAIEVVVRVDAGLDLTGTLKAEASYGVRSSVRGRIEAGWTAGGGWYWDPDWKPAMEPTNPSGLPTMSIGASFEAKGYARAKVIARLYGLAGPYLGVGPYARFEGKAGIDNGDPYCDWGLWWGIDGLVGLDLRWLGPDVNPDPIVRPLVPERLIVRGDCAWPGITATVPKRGATGVPLDTAISATFSESMDPATINATTFTVSKGVTGTITYHDTTATLTPDAPLAPDTEYTVTILGIVEDSTGTPMVKDYIWSFTTQPGIPVWQLNFTGKDSHTQHFECSTHGGCTFCPSLNRLYFLRIDDELSFREFPLTEDGLGGYTCSLSGLSGWFGTFYTDSVAASLTGTVRGGSYDFTLELSGAVTDHWSSPSLFDVPAPFQGVFTVSGATPQDGAIVGDATWEGSVHTGQGNCVVLTYEETTEGRCNVVVGEAPPPKRAPRDRW